MQLKAGANGTRINKRGVYTVSDDRVAFSTSFLRRAGARIFDYIIGGLTGFLIYVIFTNTQIMRPESANIWFDGQIQNFSIYSHDLYNGWFIGAYSASIIGILITTMLIPLINWKYLGQSLGKMLLGVAPIFEGKFAYGKFILKEMIITTPVLISYVFGLIIGIDPVWLFVQWNTYAQKVNQLPNIGLGPIKPIANNPFDFFANIWSNSNHLGALASTSLMSNIGWAKSSFQIITLIWMIIISISILFDPVKRSIADKASNIAIIDTRTLQSQESYMKIFKEKTKKEEYELNENKTPVLLKK